MFRKIIITIIIIRAKTIGRFAEQSALIIITRPIYICTYGANVGRFACACSVNSANPRKQF